MAKKQTKKVREERLEDILWSCRNHLRGKADMSDKQEEKLKNALPQNLFVSCDFEPSVLKSVMEELDKIDRTRFGEKDLIGRVYEYYLQAFSINADKEEGEFYTPRSITRRPSRRRTRRRPSFWRGSAKTRHGSRRRSGSWGCRPHTEPRRHGGRNGI